MLKTLLFHYCQMTECEFLTTAEEFRLKNTQTQANQRLKQCLRHCTPVENLEEKLIKFRVVCMELEFQLFARFQLICNQKFTEMAEFISKNTLEEYQKPQLKKLATQKTPAQFKHLKLIHKF